MAIIAAAVLFRFLPHVPNMTPIAAMALFGGAFLPKRWAVILPLAAMVLSDIVLGFSLVTPFIYGSFLVTGFLGIWLKKHKRPETVISASLISSTLFFLITNFGVWAQGMLYPRTMHGLTEAYLMGLPFFRNTIIGDLLYTGLLFVGYASLRALFTNRKAALAHV